MNFISVKIWAERMGVSQRTARNYCTSGKIPGAFLVGKTWSIPEDAQLPLRKKLVPVSPLLAILREQKNAKLKGGIYHRIQIDLTYNSNHIEGSKLTHDQTRYIFETNTIGITDAAINVDDIIEATNHFRAFDFIIDTAETKLSENYIKHIHLLLKSGTSDAEKSWFNVGDYKKLPNEVGGMDTTLPEDVHTAMKALLKHYNSLGKISLDDILNFHHQFESIHPFQDGNGRVGRLIMFRECLRNNIVPFIITDDLKMFYYNGLRNWPKIKEFLTDTCLSAQDSFKHLLLKFRIPH
jgi:Fic family protein